MSTQNTHTKTDGRPRWFWRLVRRFFPGAIEFPSEMWPVIEEGRQVKWWPYRNEHGVHMIKVVDMLNGWSVESNQFHGRLPYPHELSKLIEFLRMPPNTKDEPRAQNL